MCKVKKRDVSANGKRLLYKKQKKMLDKVDKNLAIHITDTQDSSGKINQSDTWAHRCNFRDDCVNDAVLKML